MKSLQQLRYLAHFLLHWQGAFLSYLLPHLDAHEPVAFFLVLPEGREIAVLCVEPVHALSLPRAALTLAFVIARPPPWPMNCCLAEERLKWA